MFEKCIEISMRGKFLAKVFFLLTAMVKLLSENQEHLSDNLKGDI